MKILDCSLRDGGYYTNWDFEQEFVQSYIEATNVLPIDYIEIGYRSKMMPTYHGEYFYSPIHVVERIRAQSNKKIAVMINQKDVLLEDLNDLLSPVCGLVDMVRIAVDPKNIKPASRIAERLKHMGFEVGFNVMYMSKWSEQNGFMSNLSGIENKVDYFNMVDSFGGVYPSDLKAIYKEVRSKTSVPIGFHGHNNLELALINSLTALGCGAEIVDATFTGMGRGAGNLKTELLLTALKSKELVEIEFNTLSAIVSEFESLREKFNWGTILPYMVSGANSLPQKEVMEWVSKRFYSLSSIIQKLANQTEGKKDNINLPELDSKKTFDKVLIMGGGSSCERHANALQEFLRSNVEVAVIYASSKNVRLFDDLENFQAHCLSGNEGHRLEKELDDISIKNRIAILPPYPRRMGTYIPSVFVGQAYQLTEIEFFGAVSESVTSLAIQAAITFDSKEIIFAGYDGYGDSISPIQLDLFMENELIFSRLSKSISEFYSVTPSRYESLKVKSIYAMV